MKCGKEKQIAAWISRLQMYKTEKSVKKKEKLSL